MCGSNRMTSRWGFLAVLGLAAATVAGAAAAATGGPPISDVQAIALDPVHHGTIYAGVYSGSTPGGVYKSTDGGASWTLLNADTNVVTDVRALVVDPLTPTTVYAGTTYAGVLKSTDGGATWNPMNTGLGALPSVESLAIDPVTPATLYTSVIGGIFKSTDGGANWSAANNGLSSTDVLGITLQPGNPATLYARVNGGGVFKSTNSAGSWVAMNTGLASLYVYSLVIDPVTPATLYAGTYDSGVFKSSDAGATWTAINSGLTDLHMGTALAIDPANPGTVYATSRAGVWKTMNGGASWTSASAGLEATATINGGSFYALAVDPSSPATVYLGGLLGGFYKSVDGAATWTASDNGLSTRPVVLALAVEHANPANVYAATLWGADLSYLGGIFKSPNGGAGWTEVSFGLDGVQSLAIDSSYPATIYAGPIVNTVGFLSGGGVIKSTDGGATWNAANTGLPTISGMAHGGATSTFAGINGFAINPSNPTTVYCAPGNQVFKTTDGGGNWTAADAGLPASSTILSLAVDPANPATVYAGASVGTVFVSRDAGGSWNGLSVNLPNMRIQALAVSPGNSSTLYAGTDLSGVFISRDGGANWAQANSGLTNLSVLSLAPDPAVPATIYAGTNGDGVFKSTDGGATWQATGNDPGNGAAPATMISIVSGDTQTGIAGQALSHPLVVVVTNSENIPVAGVAVSFSVFGGGSVSATSVVSDSQGVASTSLTLSANPGTNTVTATEAGISGWQVVFSTTGMAAAPGISVAGVANSASFTQSFSPGMLLSVFGTGLSSGSPQTFGPAPLPLTSASGTSVTINGIAASLLYVSATQINLQIPYELAAGTANLVVRRGGQSASIGFTIQAAAPGIFVDYRNGNIVPNESAAVGSTIGFYVTGAGLTTPAVATGNAPSAGTTPVPNLPATVTIGGVTATPAYVGIPSWSVGVLQINVTAPVSLTAGYQAVVVDIGGVKSKPALLNVTR